MPSESSNARWISLGKGLAGCRFLPLAVTLAAVFWCLSPSKALAASLVPAQSAISEHEARHLLARLYSYSIPTLPQAEAEYRRLLAMAPANSEISLELAEVLLRQGRQDEAQKLYLTLDPKDPRVAVGLGDAFFASGRMAEAAAAYQRARDAGSQRPDLGLRLAQALAWSDQADRAVPLLAELHALRGALNVFGMEWLAKQSAELSQALKQGDMQSHQTRFARFCLDLQRTFTVQLEPEAGADRPGRAAVG